MSECLLKIENLTRKFGGLTAVDSVNMYVNQGEIIGLIGANGAGKTTVFNMISGSFRPTTGKIIFNNIEIEHKPAHLICRLGVGRTYQIVQPFTTLTVLENTIVGALLKYPDVSAARKKSIEILKLLDMEERRDVKGSNLSLPELKRMEVARALATEPKLLLLDEVMAGLNPTDSAEFVNIIRKIRDTGVTIILIEHVMKAVMSLSDRIYVLNQGKLISEGTPEHVSNDPLVIESYLGSRKIASETIPNKEENVNAES